MINSMEIGFGNCYC